MLPVISGPPLPPEEFARVLGELGKGVAVLPYGCRVEFIMIDDEPRALASWENEGGHP